MADFDENDCSSGRDWIDEALESGFGFQNEEEKRAYLASLGDPLEHPLFAMTADDCKDHPLSSAFRALNEEDKSAAELAAMYKEEGNQWLKHGTAKDFKEAHNCYTHAISHTDKALTEIDETLPHSEKEKTALMLLKSQIFGNRAQVHI
jgi:hypothetical protein